MGERDVRKDGEETRGGDAGGRSETEDIHDCERPLSLLKSVRT
jgi:hypothetical protein